MRVEGWLLPADVRCWAGVPPSGTLRPDLELWQLQHVDVLASLSILVSQASLVLLHAIVCLISIDDRIVAHARVKAL